MNGIGVYTWPDSQKRYLGEYKMNQKQGYGMFTLNDGNSYEGYWRNGKGHGLGRFTKVN